MRILFGHPTGSPFSHNAALAHFETGRLERFCVPWMPSERTLHLLDRIEPLRAMTQRLSRRHFPPLAKAPKSQGRTGELRRLLIRAAGWGDDRLANEANDWLMRTMTRECRRPGVTAVHAYEDCSLWQFAEAKHLGKACIYDMPIGYYPAWETIEAELARGYVDWLPIGGLPSSRYVRPEQKREEMNLANLVLVPSSFAEVTIRTFHPYKVLARAPYGVDLDFWKPAQKEERAGPLRFIYAGQLSLRKGIPILLEAWNKAALRDAELELVGSWQLADSKRSRLPCGVTLRPPCSAQALRDRYHAADIFVFPSYFEGFGLVLLEAMACGLPAITSGATAGPDVMTEACGRLLPTGNLDALVESMRWFDKNREKLPDMSRASRAQATHYSWENYRRCVAEAVAPFV
jgi:glycosyltransferase involved in cell wall biosynthesis